MDDAEQSHAPIVFQGSVEEEPSPETRHLPRPQPWLPKSARPPTAGGAFEGAQGGFHSREQGQELSWSAHEADCAWLTSVTGLPTVTSSGRP